MQFQLINYHHGTDVYSMITDKKTVVMMTHLFKVGKKSERHDRATICFYC